MEYTDNYEGYDVDDEYDYDYDDGTIQAEIQTRRASAAALVLGLVIPLLIEAGFGVIVWFFLDKHYRVWDFGISSRVREIIALCTGWLWFELSFLFSTTRLRLNHTTIKSFKPFKNFSRHEVWLFMSWITTAVLLAGFGFFFDRNNDLFRLVKDGSCIMLAFASLFVNMIAFIIQRAAFFEKASQ